MVTEQELEEFVVPIEKTRFVVEFPMIAEMKGKKSKLVPKPYTIMKFGDIYVETSLEQIVDNAARTKSLVKSTKNKRTRVYEPILAKHPLDETKDVVIGHNTPAGLFSYLRGRTYLTDRQEEILEFMSSNMAPEIGIFDEEKKRRPKYVWVGDIEYVSPKKYARYLAERIAIETQDIDDDIERFKKADEIVKKFISTFRTIDGEELIETEHRMRILAEPKVIRDGKKIKSILTAREIDLNYGKRLRGNEKYEKLIKALKKGMSKTIFLRTKTPLEVKETIKFEEEEDKIVGVVKFPDFTVIVEEEPTIAKDPVYLARSIHRKIEEFLGKIQSLATRTKDVMLPTSGSYVPSKMKEFYEKKPMYGKLTPIVIENKGRILTAEELFEQIGDEEANE